MKIEIAPSEFDRLAKLARKGIESIADPETLKQTDDAEVIKWAGDVYDGRFQSRIGRIPASLQRFSDEYRKIVYSQERNKIIKQNPNGAKGKGLTFWLPVIAVTGGLGYLIYTMVKKPPAPPAVIPVKITETVVPDIAVNAVHLMRIGSSDKIAWNITITNKTRSLIPLQVNITSTVPGRFYDSHYSLNKSFPASASGTGDQAHLVLMSGEVATGGRDMYISEKAGGTITIRRQDTNNVLYFANWSSNPAVYSQSMNNNVVQPPLIGVKGG